MNHFKVKSLTFYGISIVSVVIIFNVVAAYGEKIKAAPPIGGDYRIESENLPECLKSEALVLNIKQSGVYLFGSLFPANSTEQTITIAEEKPSLSGRFEQGQVSLNGEIPLISQCNNGQIKIQGKLDGETLSGKIGVSSNPGETDFTAKREKPKEQPGKH